MNISKPTLIVTLLYKPNETQKIWDINKALIKQLARPTEAGGFALSQHELDQSLWINRKRSIFVTPFAENELEHLELSDIAIIQVGINIYREAVEGWCEAEERLAEALRGLPSGIEEALVGRTIVYAASIPPNSNDDADTLAQTLLDKLRLQDKHYHLPYRALAVCSFTDGKLWLLKTGRSGEDNIYMTLEPDSEENSFQTTLLFGNQAPLLYPDTITHKAYYMAREYMMGREGDKREQFREASQTLMDHIVKILEQEPLSAEGATDIAPSSPQPLSLSQNNLALHGEQLNHLSQQAANYTLVSVELRRLHSALEVHQFHYQLSQEEHPFGDISRYHEQQLKNTLFRIQQDNKDASAILDAINTALNYLRADYERKQAQISERAEQKADQHAEQKAKADKLTQDMLAIMTVALTVGQLVDQLWLGWQLLSIIGSGIATWLLIYTLRKRGGTT